MLDVDALLGIKPPEARAKRDRHPIPLEGDHQITTSARRRRVTNSLKADAALDALESLPGPGETLHGLMNGKYDGFDFVEAVITRAASRVRCLRIATLGFNERNAIRLFDMMDAGTIHRATMIVSAWYQADAREAQVVARHSSELPKRGGWYCSARSHAKVVTFELSDRRRFTLESSANLRTCQSIEQFALTQDKALHDFHASWMEAVRATEESRAAAAQ